jgi:hypothetical protein
MIAGGQVGRPVKLLKNIFCMIKSDARWRSETVA